MNGPPSGGKFYPAPIVINTKSLLNNSCHEWFCSLHEKIIHIQGISLSSIGHRYLTTISNCPSSHFKSGHQFSAQDNVIKNVGVPSPRAIWWVIQCLRSSVVLLQSHHSLLYFLQSASTCLYILYFCFPAVFSAVPQLVGLSQWIGQSWRRNYPLCYLYVPG